MLPPAARWALSGPRRTGGDTRQGSQQPPPTPRQAVSGRYTRKDWLYFTKSNNANGISDGCMVPRGTVWILVNDVYNKNVAAEHPRCTDAAAGQCCSDGPNAPRRDVAAHIGAPSSAFSAVIWARGLVRTRPFRRVDPPGQAKLTGVKRRRFRPLCTAPVVLPAPARENGTEQTAEADFQKQAQPQEKFGAVWTRNVKRGIR